MLLFVLQVPGYSAGILLLDLSLHLVRSPGRSCFLLLQIADALFVPGVFEVLADEAVVQEGKFLRLIK